MAIKTRKFSIDVNDQWCKGCEICVAFCPKNVLAMENGKAIVVRADDCTGCQFCEIYCPDFAITVHPDKDEGNE